jgi:hypothetical protein
MWKVDEAQFENQHFGCLRFHSNQEVEVAVREWFRMREPDLYCSGIFKFMPRWERYIDVFEATLNAVITPHLFL